MKKPKKITVKFFLNKNLKDINGNYPLYTQITYDRKNTQIKCTYGWYYRTLEDVKQNESNLLSFEEKILHRTVSYELSKLGDEFKLKGLGKKYDHFSLSIHALFNSYLKLRLRDVLKAAQPQKVLEVLHTERAGTDFFILYDACLRLFDNLQFLINDDLKEEMEIYRVYYQLFADQVQNEDKSYRFPVVIDWLDGSHSQSLTEKFKEIFENDLTKVEKSLVLINKIINTKLELI